MPATRYVALLRGINVGGKNLVGMPALKACFESGGFTEVSTYIQSGNVLFETAKGKRGLVTDIESMLKREFGVPFVVVLRSHAQLAAVVANAPRGFGKHPEKHLSDVVFLKEPLRAQAAIKDIPRRDGVDTVSAGNGVLYFSRLKAKAAQSRLGRITSLPIYKSMTIRNWNTTTKLLSLLDSRVQSLPRRR